MLSSLGTFTCLICLALWPQAAPPASEPAATTSQPTTQASQPAASEPAAEAPSSLLQQTPSTVEDVARQIDLAKSRIAELNQAVEHDKDATDEPAKAAQTARSELVQVWQTYLESLQQFITLRDSLANLTNPEHLQALTDELATLAQETATLRRAAVPDAPSQEQIDQVQSRLSAVTAQVDALADAQAPRSKQLSEGFQSQAQPLQEQLQQIRDRREELSRKLSEPAALAAPSGEQLPLRIEKERLDVRQAIVQLALQELTPAADQARNAFEQGKRRLAVLRALQSALQDRANALNEARARTRVKQLEATKTRSPSDTALRNLKLFCERVLLAYFQSPEQFRRLQERFPQRAAERLQSRIDLAEAYWSRTRETLGYQSAQELLSLFQQSKNAIAENRVQLDALRVKLGVTLEELQQLQTVRERTLQRFNVLAEQVTATVDRTDVAQRTQIQSAIAPERAALIDSMGSAVTSVEDVSSRIGKAIERLEAHMDHLRDVQDTLRWMRLANRDSGLWSADWKGAGSDVAALWRTPPAPATNAADQSTAELHRELFGEQRDAHAEWRALGVRVGGSLRAVTWHEWLAALGGVVAAGIVGFVLYRVARRRGVRLAQEIVRHLADRRDEAPSPSSGLSARINLMLLNMVGDLSIPVLTVGALVVALWRTVPDQTTVRLVAVFFGVVMLAVVLLRLVHHLFEAESAPHRPIPCGDFVARHYRKWLWAIILFSMAALVAPVTLGAVDVAATLRSVLFEVHKTGLLLLLFLFLLRKDRVLGLGGVGELSWGLMLTWIVYPLLVMAVAALLVLEVIGYGVLVAYVGTGLLLTVGILIVIGAVIEYFSDAIDRRAWHLHHREPGKAPAVASAGRELDAGRGLYLIVLLRWFVRIAGLALILFLILRAWDVPVRAATVPWGRIGLGVLAVFVALLLDRVLLTLLLTLSATGRMPESTVRIIRRWLRGVLTIVVALTVIAIAGIDVKSLWTLLVTFLAMVAIGFVAVWSMLSNVLATLVILIWRPFNVGERISLLPEGLEGDVVDINFMFTTLKSDDGSKTSVPNNLFPQKFIRRQAVRGQPKRTLAEQLEADKPLDE